MGSSIFEAFSDYRELRNLAEALEKHVKKGKLKHCEGFLLDGQSSGGERLL